MSIIVTAAAGRLGGLVVESLLERGADPASIVATARDTAKLQSFADRGVRVARLDYDAPDTVGEVVTAGDVLVLISAPTPGNRVALHAGVIDAAKAAGVGRIVYTSAPAATTSALILAPEHKGTEEHLAASGIATTILRNGWYTENYAGLVAQGREQGEIVAATGDGRVSSAAIKDYAEAAAVAAADDAYAGKVLELSGDVAWSFDDLAAAISRIVGAPVTHRDLQPAAYAEHLRGAGVDEGTIGFLVGLDGNIRDGLLGVTTGELAATIGHPTTPYEETLAQVG